MREQNWHFKFYDMTLKCKLTIEVYMTAANATISIEYGIGNPVTERTNMLNV
jgi:hypothetical protein